MARTKKVAGAKLEAAQKRLAGMKSIDSKLDLGEGVSVATIEAAIGAVTTAISEYNVMLSAVDAKANEIDAQIKAMNALSERALKGTGFKFGFDSNEYEMVGGTRKSERKRPTRKPKP